MFCFSDTAPSGHTQVYATGTLRARLVDLGELQDWGCHRQSNYQETAWGWRQGYKNSRTSRLGKLLGWWTHWCIGWHAWGGYWGSSTSPLPPPAPVPDPGHPFHQSVPSCILCNKPLIAKCFPDSVSHSCKLSNLMKESQGSLIYRQLFRSTGGPGLVDGI